MSPEETLAAIEEMHAERHRDIDGHTLRWCRECGQDWPCPTILVLAPLDRTWYFDPEGR